ncbi:hypothetical protein HaLaN_27585 [Haematococcus lacustris]|uniref:Uncharacterized protein n=1 Tax=Haematococcus lacustris TaxID=44745 RepID=A0A6A0A980_HAELA|nr:hypothetical protein HaLaN_27585 [Haematococcus lacustris]
MGGQGSGRKRKANAEANVQPNLESPAQPRVQHNLETYRQWRCEGLKAAIKRAVGARHATLTTTTQAKHSHRLRHLPVQGK